MSRRTGSDKAMKNRSPKRRAGTEGTEATHETEVGEGTELVRDKESESQSGGVTDDTHDTDEVPPLATSVRSLQEAVRVALDMGVGENCLFNFARALKALEVTTNFNLPPDQREQAFVLWWQTAKPLLPADADSDEYRFLFYDAVTQAKTPLGANPLNEAITRADASPLPAEAARYTSAKLKRLVAVCSHLQVLQGDSPFFLGLRDAASILGTKSLPQARAMLAGLARDGLLTVISKGTPGGRRATRFRFNRASCESSSSAAATSGQTTNLVSSRAETVTVDRGDSPLAELVESFSKEWNSTPGLPSLVRLAGKRRKALEARLTDDPFFAQQWRAGIERMAASPFCTGSNPRGWRANLDWFLKEGTLERLLEGNYDKPSTAAVASQASASVPQQIRNLDILIEERERFVRGFDGACELSQSERDALKSAKEELRTWREKQEKLRRDLADYSAGESTGRSSLE